MIRKHMYLIVLGFSLGANLALVFRVGQLMTMVERALAQRDAAYGWETTAVELSARLYRCDPHAPTPIPPAPEGGE